LLSLQTQRADQAKKNFENISATENVLRLQGKTEKEKLFEIWKSNNKFNRSETAELLGISRRSVQNWCKEFEYAHLNAQSNAQLDPSAGLG